ncbi:MAG: hypothetical protein F6J93_11925 [Oscillatoria sp. SIO1A7]|nr:hypothetical protein [Oscillatoria sp. SIO1A7]
MTVVMAGRGDRIRHIMSNTKKNSQENSQENTGFARELGGKCRDMLAGIASQLLIFAKKLSRYLRKLEELPQALVLKKTGCFFWVEVEGVIGS